MSASPLAPSRIEACDLERVASLPSTSDACVERARAGAPDGLAILAESQTAGRGSRGRAWACPPGNLYLSLLIRPRNREEASGAGQWALLAGIALIEALRPFDVAPGHITLKWPNDVLRDGAKLAGVLVDAALRPDGRADWLVIGVGANIACAPVVEGRAIAALVPRAGTAPAAEAVARAFLARIEAWRGVLAEAGFAPVRGAWLAAAHPLGTPVRVQAGSRIRAGVFAGLSPLGELLLSEDGRLSAISTGDVLLGQGI